MPASTELSPLLIGDFRFDPRSHELWREGDCQRLPRRLSQLLLRLAQAAPDVLSRQQLIDEVWQRRMVEDDVLSRAIAELRRALGDDPKSPRFIETIPKAGYRWCAAVRPAPDQVAASLPSGLALPVAADRRPRPRWWMAGAALLLAGLAITVLISLQHDSGPQSLTAADMTRTRPLTSGAGWEFRPDISPDGRWVAYSEHAQGSEVTALVLQDVRGEHHEVLEAGDQANIRPAFSPDGRQLVFLRVRDGRCELALRALPGTTSRTLAPCSADPASSPAWSADQRHVAYSMVEAGAEMAGIAVVEVATGQVRVLTRPSAVQGPDRDPEFVPGGGLISFARGHDGEQFLMTLQWQAPTAQPQPLWNAGRLQGHAWRADGAQLIAASDQAGYRALVLLDANGALIEVLGARGGRFPAWSASGALVFESAQYDANIWQLDLATPDAAPKLVVASTRYDASPTLSGDGRHLAFVSNRNDFEQIFVANPDGSAPTRLSMPDGQRWSRPAFGPDGQQLLVTGYDEDNQHWIYRHDLASGRNLQLRHLGADSGAGQYCTQGDHILYLRRGSDGGRSLWMAGLGSEDPAVELEHSAAAEQFVITADTVVLSRIGAAGFRLLSLHAKSAPVDVLEQVVPLTPFAWTARGRHLYAVVRVADQPVLKRWHLDSGDEELLARDISADAVGPALAVSPDQRTLWFARTDNLSLDLMWVPPRTD